MSRRSSAWTICLVIVVATWAGRQPSRAADGATSRNGQAPAPATQALTSSFTGRWMTTYGPMTLRQNGDAVEGTYGAAGESSIKGKLKDTLLVFTYAEPDARGEGWFELAADGKSFNGKWRTADSPTWAQWTGNRIAAAHRPGASNPSAVAEDQSRPAPFTGLWQTPFGRMRLWQQGDQVRGYYEFADRSSLQGTVDGQTLKFHYQQPDGENGEAAVTLTDDEKAFDGQWQASAGANGKPAGYGGRWAGARLTPHADRIWLVVLEANWESGLEEHEYSFGQMLRTYFARLPEVEVRHRFFNNPADLRRWCQELTFLAEPVVLHISCHGSKQAVLAGGEQIDAKFLAKCLRDAGDVRLLHFGTCLLGGGDVPKQIFDALGADARFPISGYKRVADWGGSAVIDFNYLELVLAKRLPPAAAAEQTRRMITFARDQETAGTLIPAAGLVCFDPPGKKRSPQDDVIRMLNQRVDEAGKQ
jgi:hypothetical protein